MKRIYLLLIILLIMGSSTSFAQVPRKYQYQKTLVNYLGTLKKKDFVVKLQPVTVKRSYFHSIDDLYRAWLFLHEPYDMMGTKGLRVHAKYFPLDAITKGGKVHMTDGKVGFMKPIATAFWAIWDYPGNPYYKSRAVKLRAFDAAAIDMIMEDRDINEGHNKRSDYIGMQLTRWAFVYGAVKDILPAKVRKAYEKGLIKMFNRIIKWGPTGIHADMDVATTEGVLYTAKFVDSEDLTQQAHQYIDKLLEEHLAAPGYIDHGGSYDAGYEGISTYFMNWAAQLSGYKPLVKALKKMGTFKAYMTLPDPDGNSFSLFQTNPSSGGDAPHDYWGPYSRDVGVAYYCNDAAYLVFKGAHIYGRNNRANMFEDLKKHVRRFNNKAAAHNHANLLSPLDRKPGIWKHEHWNLTNALNATAFYYKEGLYDKFKLLKDTHSPYTKPPFGRDKSFTKSFADKYLAIKRKTYGAIIDNDQLSWWTKKGQTKGLRGFGGGNLGAFWTPRTGSVVLGGTRVPGHSIGLDLKDWRIWPVNALSGETTNGQAFSSGLQRYPKADYELNRTPKEVTITGDLGSTYSDPRNSLQGEVDYKRVFKIKRNGIEVTASVHTHSDNKVHSLYEIIPIYRHNTDHQSRAESTSIDFKVDGKWQQAGADFKTVTSIRLKRFNGAVYIDFKRPQRVKLSPHDFYQHHKKKKGFQARNIMIDLLRTGGKSAKLKDTSVSYFLRSSKAEGNKNWDDPPPHSDAPPHKLPVSIKPYLQKGKKFLTASLSEQIADALNVTYDWQIDKESIAVVNLPFDIPVGDDKTTVHNYTSYHNNGQVKHASQAPGWVPYGRDGGAYIFDGKDDYVEIPAKEDKFEAFTIEAWVKPDNWGDSWATLVSKPISGSSWMKPYAVFKLSRKSTQKSLNLQITVGNGKAVSIQSDYELPNHQWTFVSGTYDGQDLKLYINGKLDTSSKIGKTLDSKKGTSIFIGKHSNIDNGDKERFKGAMDEVRVLKIALSSKQIKNDYNGRYGRLYRDQFKTDPQWRVAVSINNGQKHIDPVIVGETGSGITDINETDDNTPPKVEISYSPVRPHDGEAVIFKAKARDENKIKKIKMYINGELQHTCIGTSRCTFKKESLKSGSYTYYAKTADHALNTARSDTKTIVVSDNALKPVQVSLKQETKNNYLKPDVGDVPGGGGNKVHLNYDWRVNEKSTALVNLPFDVPMEPTEDAQITDSSSLHNVEAANYSSTKDNGITVGRKAIPGWSEKGKKGGAYLFDGKHDFVKVLTNQSFKELNKITLEAWIKPDNMGGGWNAIISKPFPGDSSQKKHWGEFLLSRNSATGDLKLQITVGDGFPINMYSKQQVPAHKWSYVAGTYDGKDLKLYINGQLDRTMHVDKQLVTKGNTDVFIGKRGNSGKNEAHYKGLLDEVRVYNRALTPGQIKQHQALNYDKLSLDQAKDGERWAVAVTANNGKEISKTTMSNSVIVEKVQQADDPSDKTSVSYNYPNPFHASTKFKLKLSKKQHVSIKVYNVLGRLVYTKFEGNKSKGPHIIKIDGNKLNLASGVYFCRFAMDDKVITQKMTYIK